MQEESSSGESTFEFVDKKTEGAAIAPGEDGDGAVSGNGSNLLSKVAPPSALPSFVPLPQTTATTSLNSSNQSFHPTTFSPVIPAEKGSVTTTTAPATTAVTTELSVNQNQSGLFGWVKDAVGSASILTKVAEKAKSSVDSMITTFDPQMKEFLSPGSEMEVIVASDKEIKISPVREAFQSVFGRVNVRGLGAEAKNVAAQPVGYEAALRAAWERIEAVRSLQPSGPIVAIENFIVEITPDKWYDLGALVLSDAERGLVLETFTQMTPVPSSIVTLAQDDTPDDYPLSSTGFSITVGGLMASNLHVHHSEWHHALTGVSRRDMLLLSAKSLANIYKNSIQ
ncbi:protein PRRC1-A-like [Lycorma delicatula]|uniref:protein PRRC1-A-like n=1 Tax=Lycorma delicatula TaxID=130591 RepID=UPI003F51915F